MEDLILQIAAAIVTALIGYISLLVKRRFGIEIEAIHREALHSAIMSGVDAAIRRGPGAAVEVLVDGALAHARASVPDAISALAPTNAVLRNIAQSYAMRAIERIENAFIDEAVPGRH